MSVVGDSHGPMTLNATDSHISYFLSFMNLLNCIVKIDNLSFDNFNSSHLFNNVHPNCCWLASVSALFTSLDVHSSLN